MALSKLVHVEETRIEFCRQPETSSSHPPHRDEHCCCSRPFLIKATMKFHSLLVSAALFTSSASAASYDYSLNGDDACVLINVAMDKSGSMQTEQTWMRENSIPAMVAKLQGAEYGYDHIFVCSHQFGRDAQAPPGAHGFETLGCSDGFDAGILGWTASTDVEVEDGYHAIEEAIANVDAVIGGIDLAATCGTMDRNMILVTDEVSMPNRITWTTTFPSPNSHHFSHK